MKIFIYIALVLCAIIFHPLKVCAANGSGVAEIQCKECGKTFSNMGNLKNHKRKHTGEKPFKCTECEKCFSHSSNLTMHMRTHTGEKPFKCTECDKYFTKRDHLNTHMRKHTGEKPFKCETCWKLFSDNSDYKRHMRLHTGEKPFKCTECDKCFARRDYLNKHMHKHTGDKPFKCTECEKCFAQRVHLNMHKRKHTGEKPFKCTECDKYFAQRAHLNRHKLTHTGEKYKCTICDKSFLQACSLKNHMITHTKKNTHKCKECEKCFTRKDSLTRHIQNKHLEQSPQTSEHSKEDRSQCNNPKILEDQATDELNEIIQQCYEIFCTIENKTTKETPYKIREFLWRLKVYSEILQVVLKLSVGTVVWELNGDQIVSLSESISNWIKLICDKTSLPCNKEMLSTDQDADAFHAIAIDIYRILDYFYLRKQTDTQEEIQQKKTVILIEEIRVQLFLIDPHLKEGLTD